MKTRVTISFETDDGNNDFWTIAKLIRYYRRQFEKWIGDVDNNYRKLDVIVEEIKK